MEKVAEYQLQRLSDTIKSIRESVERTNESMKDMRSTILCVRASFFHLALMGVLDKYEHCIKKLSKATFLTRWYWKRRLSKVNAKMGELINLLQEAKTEIEAEGCVYPHWQSVQPMIDKMEAEYAAGWRDGSWQ